MKQTIAQKITAELEAEGHKLLGKTSGTMTFRKGSNLARKLESMGLTENDVIVRTGARAGRNKTEGYELLIFSR